MTAIERTAYPRLKQGHYRKTDLDSYLPTDEDLQYMKDNGIRSEKMMLNFILQLKTYQKLHYFPKLESVPKTIIKKISKALGITKKLKLGYTHSDTKYRHRNLIREYLSINTDSKKREKIIRKTASDKAKVMNDPADIINAVIEELIDSQFELPAFREIDRVVSHIRHNRPSVTERVIFRHISAL